jgi:hypothetical protein
MTDGASDHVPLVFRFIQYFFVEIFEMTQYRVLIAALLAAFALTACGEKAAEAPKKDAAAPAQQGMSGMSGMGGMSGMAGQAAPAAAPAAPAAPAAAPAPK